jgi:hypothetical protein
MSAQVSRIMVILAPVVIGLMDTRTEAMSAQVVSRIMVILAQVITDLEDITIEATIKPLT